MEGGPPHASLAGPPGRRLAHPDPARLRLQRGQQRARAVQEGMQLHHVVGAARAGGARVGGGGGHVAAMALGKETNAAGATVRTQSCSNASAWAGPRSGSNPPAVGQRRGTSHARMGGLGHRLQHAAGPGRLSRRTCTSVRPQKSRLSFTSTWRGSRRPLRRSISRKPPTPSPGRMCGKGRLTSGRAKDRALLPRKHKGAVYSYCPEQLQTEERQRTTA